MISENNQLDDFRIIMEPKEYIDNRMGDQITRLETKIDERTDKIIAVMDERTRSIERTFRFYTTLYALITGLVVTLGGLYVRGAADVLKEDLGEYKQWSQRFMDHLDKKYDSNIALKTKELELMERRIIDQEKKTNIIYRRSYLQK